MLLPAAGAGLAIGYLALTRPFDALAIGGGVAICWLAAVLKGHDQYLFRAGVIGAVSAGLVALLLPIYWRAVTGEWMVNPYLEVYPYDHPGFGPHVGPRGFFPKDALTYTGSNLLAMAHSFLGWPAYLSLIFVPVTILAGPRADRPFLLPVLICSVILVYGTYWYYGGCDAGFPRYYTAALPCLLLLSGRGIELVAQWLRAHGGVRLPTLYPLLVLLVAFNAFTFLPGQLVGFRGKYGVTAAGVKAIQAARVEPALVLVTEVDEWNDFAPFFAANSPSLDSEIVYAIYRDARQAGRLRALFPGRACFLWAGSRLIPCAPDLDAGLSVGCRVGQGCS